MENDALPTASDSWDGRRFAGQLGVLGERVRTIRRFRCGWSQQDLADRTGIGRRRVWGIESGRQNLTLELLWRMANLFRMHWADLLDDRTSDPPCGHHIPVPFDQQRAAFGGRVYQARVLQRLTQQALTDRTGIGRSAISEIEDGAENITLKTLSRLASGLGVHWADLLDDRRSTPPQSVDLGSTDDKQREPAAPAEVLADAFDRHDQPCLAELSDVELHRQRYARRLLCDYLDQMWHDAQHDRLSVAVLRDFVHHLLVNARNEQATRDLRG